MHTKGLSWAGCVMFEVLLLTSAFACQVEKFQDPMINPQMLAGALSSAAMVI